MRDVRRWVWKVERSCPQALVGIQIPADAIMPDAKGDYLDAG